MSTTPQPPSPEPSLPPQVSPAELRPFRDPRSVTVVGASANPAKWGYWLATGALAGAHRRAVQLVNRSRTPVAGYPSVTSIEEVEGELDLVVLCVPASALPQVVHAALDRGAKAFLAIPSGIDRALGRPGAELELAREIRGRGARLVGPNCLGLYDATSDLRLAWGQFSPGSLGIVSQSGQLGSELAILAAERGLGVSRFVSVGNQVDVTAAEMLHDLADHDQTRVVALYLESFADGHRLIESVRTLRAAGKHTLLLTVGASEASRSAAVSHTGAMTSALDVVDAACRAAGAVRVDTPTQLIEAAHLLLGAPAPKGRRVAVVGDSGGQGAVAADVFSGHGLCVEPLHPEVQARLAGLLPPDAGRRNPVDLDGSGERDMDTYAAIVELLIADPAVDAVALTGYFGSYGFNTPSLAEREESVARRIAAASLVAGKPIVLHSICRESATIELIQRLGVPAYHDIGSAGLSLAKAAEIATTPGRDLPSIPALPAVERVGYLAARQIFAGTAVGFPAAERVRSQVEVVDAASRLRPPYVLKADWLLHKTEAGGVRLAIPDSRAAAAAFAAMAEALGTGDYVLEEMDTRADTVEMIIGGRHDEVFGPVVVVGAGGTETELLRDVALELAPVDEPTAAAMVRRLRTDARLSGWRGAPAVDRAGLVRAIVAVSRIIAGLPAPADIELNPVRVGVDRVLAVDALVTSTPDHQES